jgi:hypothetical protein
LEEHTAFIFEVNLEAKAISLQTAAGKHKIAFAVPLIIQFSSVVPRNKQ